MSLLKRNDIHGLKSVLTVNLKRKISPCSRKGFFSLILRRSFASQEYLPPPPRFHKTRRQLFCLLSAAPIFISCSFILLLLVQLSPFLLALCCCYLSPLLYLVHIVPKTCNLLKKLSPFVLLLSSLSRRRKWGRKQRRKNRGDVECLPILPPLLFAQSPTISQNIPPIRPRKRDRNWQRIFYLIDFGFGS